MLPPGHSPMCPWATAVVPTAQASSQEVEIISAPPLSFQDPMVQEAIRMLTANGMEVNEEMIRYAIDEIMTQRQALV